MAIIKGRASVCILPAMRPGAMGGVAQHILGLQDKLSLWGWDVVEDAASADLVHVHAAEPSPVVDVYTNHGIHPISDHMPDWQRNQNATIFDLIKYADQVIAVAEWTAAQWSHLTGTKPHIIPNGIDVAAWSNLQPMGIWRAKLGIPEDTPILLWGKVVLSEICDPTPALELALQRPDVAVIMTATTKQLPQAPANVHLVGRQKLANMRDLMAEADAYLATTKENHGIQVLEAMAAGTPILGYDWGGTTETIKDRHSGRLVEPGDLDGLSVALDDLLQQADTYTLAAWQDVNDKYSLTSMAERTAAVYEQALANKRRRQRAPAKCSIVIPCYNKARFIGETIKSAMAQIDAPGYEIIVIDDGSTDDSKARITEALRDTPRSPHLVATHQLSQENKGVAAARNAGIDKASGELITCLDADDMIDARFLARLSAAMDADPGLGIAYPDMVTFGVRPIQGQMRRWKANITATDYDFELLKKRNFIPCCNVFRKKAWQRAGGYKHIDPSWEDYELWLNMGKLGWYGQRVPGGLFYYRKLQREGRDYGARNASMQLRARINTLHRDLYDPMVSVIIPCYGQSEFLDEAITSALAQTMQDLEVIVIDDGNEPDEAARIRQIVEWYEVPDVRLVTHVKNRGLAAARNSGIHQAAGTWIVPLDADDKIAPGYIEACLRALHLDPNQFAYTDSMLWYPDEGRTELLEAEDYNFTDMLSKISWPCTALYSKAAWEQAGGYSSEMSAVGGWEDWDFMITLGELGICGLRVPEPLFYYRQHSAEQMRKTAMANKPRLQETIRRRHAAVYRGERPMGCCGGSRGPTNAPTITELEALAARMPEAVNGQAIVRYTGQSAGPRKWITPADNSYEFYRAKPLQSMPAYDAAYFDTLGDFELVAQ